MDVPKAAQRRKMTPKEIYEGSDGDATKAMYGELQKRGPIGAVAMNLFRASKCSARAKVYRGGNSKGRYRAQAYERKQWSMDNLCAILLENAEALGIRWGWKQDPDQEFHDWVLYVDLPGVGQVSFHTSGRGKGPDYAGEWDRTREAAARIIAFTAAVLSQAQENAILVKQSDCGTCCETEPSLRGVPKSPQPSDGARQ